MKFTTKISHSEKAWQLYRLPGVDSRRQGSVVELSPSEDSRLDGLVLLYALSVALLVPDPFLSKLLVLVNPPLDEDNRFFMPLTSASDLSNKAERSFDGSTLVGPPLEYTPVYVDCRCRINRQSLSLFVFHHSAHFLALYNILSCSIRQCRCRLENDKLCEAIKPHMQPWQNLVEVQNLQASDYRQFLINFLVFSNKRPCDLEW